MNLITRSPVTKTDFFSPKLLFSLLTMTSPELLGRNFFTALENAVVFSMNQLGLDNYLAEVYKQSF